MTEAKALTQEDKDQERAERKAEMFDRLLIIIMVVGGLLCLGRLSGK